MKKYAFAMMFIPVSALADKARIEAVVLDGLTQTPLEGVCVQANFAEDIGWRAWTKSPVPDVDKKRTDRWGRSRLQGKTNCGVVDCFVAKPPTGYYIGDGWCHTYTNKNLFGVWQPDNLVATIRLQRVEHPIPLYVKRVELRDYERGIGGFDGTNSVLRFDLMKGDWLPPYGKGEIADLCVTSKVEITGTGKYRKAYPEFGWASMDFYDLKTTCSVLAEDGIAEFVADPKVGIRIRMILEDPQKNRVLRKRGVVQKFEKNGDGWYTSNFNDENPDRCYTFRIRTRRDDKGKLVEAYYGKIYGDFEFEGDDKKGLIGVKFLYYLNPKSLDRNLEWDMKTNLCPTAGKHESRQP